MDEDNDSFPIHFGLPSDSTVEEEESKDDIAKYYPKKKSVTFADPMYIQKYAQEQQGPTHFKTDKQFKELLKQSKGNLVEEIYEFYDYRPEDSKTKLEDTESGKFPGVQLKGYDDKFIDSTIEQSAESLSFTPEEELTDFDIVQIDEELESISQYIEDDLTIESSLESFSDIGSERRSLETWFDQMEEGEYYEDFDGEMQKRKRGDTFKSLKMEIRISESDEKIIKELLEEIKAQVIFELEEEILEEGVFEEFPIGMEEPEREFELGQEWPYEGSREELEYMTEGKEEIPYDKEELLEMYEKVIAERSDAKMINKSLLLNIAQLLKARKVDDIIVHEKDVDEKDYHQLLELVDKLDKKHIEEQRKSEEMVKGLTENNAALENAINAGYLAYIEKIRKVSQHAIHSQTSSNIPNEIVENFLIKDKESDEIIRKIRLNNIRERFKLEKAQTVLKTLIDLPDDYAITRYEKLKGDFLSYQVQIEQITKDTINLQRKYVNNIQLVSHFREKAEYLKKVKDEQSNILEEYKTNVDEKLNELKVIKTSKVAIHRKLRSLHPEFGLVGRNNLIFDFDDLASQEELLDEEIRTLKMRYVSLNPSYKNRKAFLPKEDEKFKSKVRNKGWEAEEEIYN